MSSREETIAKHLPDIRRRQPKIINEFFELHTQWTGVQGEALLALVQSGHTPLDIKGWKNDPNSEVPSEYKEKVQAILNLSDETVDKCWEFSMKVTEREMNAYWALARVGLKPLDIIDQLEKAKTKRKFVHITAGSFLMSRSRCQHGYDSLAIDLLPDSGRYRDVTNSKTVRV